MNNEKRKLRANPLSPRRSRNVLLSRSTLRSRQTRRACIVGDSGSLPAPRVSSCPQGYRGTRRRFTKENLGVEKIAAHAKTRLRQPPADGAPLIRHELRGGKNALIPAIFWK